MIKRRASFIAALLVAIAVAAIGLGAQRNVVDGTAGHDCETDLGSVYEMCQRGETNCPCEHAPQAYAEACQVGCVMAHCPTQVSCAKDTPRACEPCTDMNGGLFWKHLLDAAERCNDKLHVGAEPFDLATWDACRRAEMEQRCPALQGKPWRGELERAIER